MLQLNQFVPFVIKAKVIYCDVPAEMWAEIEYYSRKKFFFQWKI